MNMQDQEPSVSDILSSIRQILSDKIETETNSVESTDIASSSHPVQMDRPSMETDEDVFVLTSQMRVTDDKAMSPVQNQSATSFSTGLRDISLEKPTYSASQPVFSAQNAIHTEQEGTGADISPVQEIDIKPMVQAWLDKNLPQMVEKIVSEEVRRIFNKR